ncbi:hypothetical protein HPB51_000743 [Rhipicephalus microplus]|uniref:ABC-2 type transporter transmembrane domain-containing protein n=1 Tax=Rhipicephalus microplus TaxID=6941 RepID=A0A9J6EVT5_RHIMP|nr:hypothetical protein HPB51_000743 [Rhipicephalus microplus]
MGVLCTHLGLLVWKCYVIVLKRHWVAFAMELLAPAAVSLTLVFARQNMEYAHVRNVTHFEPFSLQRLPPRFHVPPPSASRWLLLYAPETNATRAVLEALAENSNPPLAGYVTEGFLYLQRQVFRHTLEYLQTQEQHHPDRNLPVTHLRLQRFPLPPHSVDGFYFIVQYFLPIIVLLSYIYPALAAVRQVGYEKESGMKDLLEMMGVNPWLNYAAWFITTVAVMTASSGLLVIVVSAPISSNGPVLRNSDPAVFFLLLVAYSASTTSFSFFVGSFFNNANTSAAALAVAYISTFSPFLFFFSLNNDHTLPTLVAACLLCNTALPVGITVTTLLEASGDGIQWRNMDVNPNPGQSLSLMSVILLLIFDTFMYIVVLWYVEVLAASQPRISWRRSLVKRQGNQCCYRVQPEDLATSAADAEKKDAAQKKNSEIFFEEFVSKEPAGVRLVNLTKAR